MLPWSMDFWTNGQHLPRPAALHTQEGLIEEQKPAGFPSCHRTQLTGPLLWEELSKISFSGSAQQLVCCAGGAGMVLCPLTPCPPLALIGRSPGVGGLATLFLVGCSTPMHVVLIAAPWD